VRRAALNSVAGSGLITASTLSTDHYRHSTALTPPQPISELLAARRTPHASTTRRTPHAARLNDTPPAGRRPPPAPLTA
jgi:hypothetical protein